MSDQEPGPVRQTHAFEIGGTTMTVTAVTDRAATIRVDTDSGDTGPDCCAIRVAVETESARSFVLHELAIAWDVAVVDLHGLYFGGNPRAELSHLPFWDIGKTVRANSGVPYLSLIARTGENRFAFGLADQLTDTRIEGRLTEATGCYHFAVRKPTAGEVGEGGLSVAGCWEETVFVSTRRAPWPEVLRAYAELVDATTGAAGLPVPAAAFDPVYCTWYAIHHDVSDAWARRQAALAAELGFGTWLTDDGWFIEDGQFADYSKAGDWMPCLPKFPDFRDHVAAIQALGLRYLLWVAPFMVGTESEAATRYRHLLIPGQERERFDNLSPWLPETGQIVTDLLTRLVTDYGLDGLKIDFLDAVRDHGGRPTGAEATSFGERFSRIMADAIDALARDKPDLLIEFRNSYSNLASRRYANLYRSSDVPFNPTLNRLQAIFLRLLVPDRAVHLDPVVWHPGESDENVAVHLINGIVSVPTISIDLERCPQSHLRLIRHWLGFYRAHRATLAHGAFLPLLRHGYVPAVAFASDTETIVAVYDDIPVAIERATSHWLLNASTQPHLDVLGSGLQGACRVVERSRFGTVVGERDVSFPQARLGVEVGGSLEIVPS